MRSGTVRILSLVLLGALLGTASFAAMHFRLERSAPEAGATVRAPAEIRLWFPEEPQAGSTSIRVVDAAGELAVDGAVEPDPDDAKIQVLPTGGPLDPGEYRIVWRAMAADGHIVRDEFTFTVEP